MAKWFKHYSNAHQGETLHRLYSKFSKAEAHGLYFLFIEYLVGKWDGCSEPVFIIHLPELRSFLRLKQNKLSSFLELTQFQSSFTYTLTEDQLKIEAPKLLEIRHRDALAAGMRLESRQQKSGVDKNKNKKKIIISKSNFETLEILLANIPEKTKETWAKYYPPDFIGRNLDLAWNHYLLDQPKGLRGWSRALSSWLERGWKWEQEKRKKTEFRSVETGFADV